MVTKNLLIRGGADFSSMQKTLRGVNQDLNQFSDRTRKSLSRINQNIKASQKQISGFKTVATKAFVAIGAALAAIGAAKELGSLVKESVKTAMTFEASMMQIQRTMGQTSEAFQGWIDQTSASMGMGRAEATQFAAVYSNLLSSFMSDTDQIATQTQALLKASAVTASATGRTMTDTMDRIRSGLLGNTESVEDLGINVNIAMIESTDAFRKFANGRSWQQLDFQTQSQIRLFAILEQATKKYGTEIADNTASRQAQFVAQLKNIQLSFGQAFLPVYNAVLPALTRMAQAISRVMDTIAAFSQALFGVPKKTQKSVDNTEKSVSGLGDAYEEAGEKAKGSVAGFDEINSLTQPSSGAGAGAGATASPEMATGGMFQGLGEKTAEVSEKMQEMADKVKNSFKSMTDFIVQNKEIILAALAGLAAGIATFLVMSNWALIVATIVKGFAAIRTAIMLTAAWFAALSWPVILISAAVAALVAGFVYFYQTNETFRGVVDGVLNAIADAAVWLWKNVLVPLGEFLAVVFVAAWDAVKIAAEWLWKNVFVPFGNFLKWIWENVLVPLGQFLATVFVAAWEVVKTVAVFLWKNVFVPLGEFLVWFYNEVITPLANILTDVLKIAFEAVSEIAKAFWKDVIEPLGAALKEMFGPAVEAVSAVLTFLWNNAVVPLGNALKFLFDNAIKPLASFLLDTFKKRWEEIIAVIKTLWDTILKPFAIYIKDTLVNTFKNAFSSIKDVINGLKDVFIGVMNFITGVFTGDMEKALEGLKKIFKGVFEALWGIVKFPLNQIIDGINTVIKGLNKISFKLPDWIPGVGGKSFGINISTIPKLAQGGIVGANSPMLAMVGDNRTQREAIAPVDDLMGMISSAVLAAMNAQGGRSGDIVLNIDGVSFARVTNPYQAKESTRIGPSMITVS